MFWVSQICVLNSELRNYLIIFQFRVSVHFFSCSCGDAHVKFITRAKSSSWEAIKITSHPWIKKLLDNFHNRVFHVFLRISIGVLWTRKPTLKDCNVRDRWYWAMFQRNTSFKITWWTRKLYSTSFASMSNATHAEKWEVTCADEDQIATWETKGTNMNGKTRSKNA